MANIASDVKIKGTIKFDGVMRVDGQVDGELITDKGEIVVGEAGTVRATVKVKSAVIEGRVEGNIRASENVLLKQKARIFGDLQAKTLTVEEGVVIVGKCNVNPDGM